MSITIGEALARRRLKPGPDSTGRMGYEKGQHHAARLGDDDCVVSYVDRSGAVCIIPCERRDGEWFQKGVMICASPNFATQRNLPRGFKLTDALVRAIQEKYGDAPSPGGRTDEEDVSQGGKESTTPPAPAAAAPKG